MDTKILKAVLPLLCLQPAVAAEKNNERPNIIFILADDLGWGDLRCYGHERIRTPNLDTMAQNGIIFTNAYMSGSVCSPTRASIMTGRFPAHTGIHGHIATEQLNKQRDMPDFLDKNWVTLPKLLQQSGYSTAHVGKWHLGTGSNAPAVTEYGFDFAISDNDKDPNFDIWGVGNRHQATKVIIDKGIEFIDKNAGDKPFYLQLWLTDPHSTLNPSEEQMEPYRNTGPGKNVPHRGITEVYYGTVTEMDAQIGRLMQALKQRGLESNTLIVFTSDNGPEDYRIFNASHSAAGSPGPFRGRKRSIYEGGIRVPFIVFWPGKAPAGKVNNQSVIASVDMLPTICRIAGTQLPDYLILDGEDMSGAFVGRLQKRTKPLFWEWRYRVFGEPYLRSPMLAIRQGDFKLLMNPDKSRVELYNLAEDPGELINLAPMNRRKTRELSGLLLQWQATIPKGYVEDVAGSNTYRWPAEK